MVRVFDLLRFNYVEAGSYVAALLWRYLRELAASFQKPGTISIFR